MSVSYIIFGVQSPTEIIEQSVCEITTSTLTKKETKVNKDTGELDKTSPLEGTVYDPRLGTIEKPRKSENSRCATCGQYSNDCPGHFGHIILNEPIMHPKFFKTIQSILKCVCHHCSKILVSKEQLEIEGYLRRKAAARLAVVKDRCAKVSICPSCGELVGKYTKDKNKNRLRIKFQVDPEDSDSEEPKKRKKKKKEEKSCDISTRDIYEIFLKISNEDYETIGFNSNLPKEAKFTNEQNLIDEDTTHRLCSRPEWLIFTVLPVLPICVRPYSIRDDKQHDDDLTDLYVNIIKYNNKLRDEKNENERKKTIDSLETHISALIDNQSEKTKVGNRAHKGLKERFTGKEGQIRKNVMGKRSDFTARTVIGPDATLRVDEIAIPPEFANELTRPEMVNRFNIDKLQKMMNEGRTQFVKRGGDLVETKKKHKIQLQYGDIVDRYLLDGDYVVINRQPTLRVESMMAFKCRIIPGKTMRTNLAVTAAFNSKPSDCC